MSSHSTGSAATATATDPVERVRSLALAILDRAPQSTHQLRAKLIRKGSDPHAVDQIIERYVDVGLLDDAVLAASIVRSRHGERGVSRRGIASELARKGFTPEQIEQALTQISDVDERAAAHGLASKRWRQMGDLNPTVKTRRIVGMLSRKGYGPGLAYEVVKTVADADTQSA